MTFGKIIVGMTLAYFLVRAD